MPSDGDAAAVVDRFSKVTHKHDFSDKISIEATYYAYYFSWLYSNFSESKTKQALECSIWRKKNYTFIFSWIKQKTTLLKHLFVIMKTIELISIFCCILVLLKFWMQLRSGELTEIFRKLYQNTLFNWSKCRGTIFKLLFKRLHEKYTKSQQALKQI